MRPDVCCTGPRPCAGAGGRRWSIRVRNTFPLISGETSCADTQMQIFVCKNNLQFSWTSQVFPHMLMLVLTAVGVELPSHWAVSSCPVSVGHWSCDVRCQVPLQTTTMVPWCRVEVGHHTAHTMPGGTSTSRFLPMKGTYTRHVYSHSGVQKCWSRKLSKAKFGTISNIWGEICKHIKSKIFALNVF